MLAVMLMLSMLGRNSISSLALEQEVRCGFEEHTHSESCYIEDVLICRQKSHVHNENCYLLLLKDNDINWLLQTIGSTHAKSLEGVIDSTLVQALTLNDEFATAAPPLQLNAAQVSSLNDTIVQNRIDPALALNENLNSGSTLTYAAPGGNASTYAVGGTASNADRVANFYIVLDGDITFVDTGVLTDDNPDYCAYSDAVNAYTDAVVTNLSTSNLGSTYHLRFNLNGLTMSPAYFYYTASYNTSNRTVGFNNNKNARHVLLMRQDGYSYDAIEFHTVTLDYSQTGSGKAPDVQYVESGLVPNISLSEYAWYDAQGNQLTQLPSITKATTLYAKSKTLTARFVDADGTEIAPGISGEPVNGALAVTFPIPSGNQDIYWIVQGSDGTTYYQSGAKAYITADTVFQSVPRHYTLTFNDETGKQTTQQVDYRQSITLGDIPAGYYWFDSGGNRYNAGAVYGPVTQPEVFTAATRQLKITYNVNFPSSAADDVDSVPTIYGTTSATATDSVTANGSIAARTLTSRTARDEISSGNKESITYFFEGWTIAGTDILIQPDTTLSGQLLESYADANGNVNLTGSWENGSRYNSVTFFVRFDSQAVDTNGNITSQPTENYTPEIFNTHVGGVDTSWTESKIKQTYEIADTSSDKSVTADRNIRALYGEKSEGVWLYDFPKDLDVFAYLKDYLKKNPTRQLTVDGISVDSEELDDKHYAIRWYVFKLEGSTWHVDGKLVRKVGTITIDKKFGGVDSAIDRAETGFYILAENGTKDAQGTFTPYPTTHSDFQQVVLVLDQATATSLRNTYRNATFHVVDADDRANDIFEWQLTDVTLGEYWRITEYPTEVSGYSYYAEYSIYDTDGEYSAIAEYGTRASVVGKTFALDEDPDQGMMVDFANYYYPNDNILLKKEDATTGQGIGGAVFEMWQNGRALKFNYNSTTGVYTQDPDGTTSRIQSGADGFATIEGFSYLHGDSTGDGARDGDITIKEVIPPSGYDKAPDAELGLDGNGNVVLKDVTGISQAEWSNYASVPNNEVAIIRDHVSDYISVTAKKVWNTSTPADSVEVVLQANGSHAATLFPGMTSAQVTLTEGNYWTYTWFNLPRYANGKEVTWSIKEVVIGGMPTLADGTSFANWIATYSPGVPSDTDSDGDIDNWSFTVTNAIRRPQLIVTKVGSDNRVLPGATFTLEQVTLNRGSWQPVSGSTVSTLTTNDQGMLTFDQLLAGSYYRLTEVQPPGGYLGMEQSIVLTVNGEGLVQQVNSDGSLSQITNSSVTHTGPYNIQVMNLKLTPLPETGGTGTTVYRQSGMLLMLAAAVLLIYNLRRKEERNSS